MNTPKQIKGYHFTGDKLRSGDPIPPIGVWLKHKGEIEVCESGLHASKHPFDALQYAPGNMLHKVVLRGGLQPHGDPIDKYVGRERKIVATLNAEKLLRDFARWSALQVIHLWDAPKVVRDYLETGDERLRALAWRVARNAAERAPAWAAARDAAWAATRAAACASTWDATLAWAAARDAAWAAARDAAWDASWDAQRNQFKFMVNESFNDK